MVLPLIPLIAAAAPALISAVGGMFGGGDKGAGASSAQSALGSLLSGGGGAGHSVSDAIDINHPAGLVAAMNSAKSGHVTPAALRQLGKPGVLSPKLETAIETIATKQRSEPVKYHQEKAARATVRRVDAAVVPHLKQMTESLKHRAMQIKATAEHRKIVEDDKRYQAIIDRQDRALAKLDRMGRVVGILMRPY